MDTEGFKTSQPPRTRHGDLQYVQRVVGGKELQHMMHATTTLQHWRAGHRTNRESETCRTVQVKRDLSRSLVQLPAQGMARQTTIDPDLPQKTKMFFGFNPLHQCLSSVLRVLIFLYYSTGTASWLASALLYSEICESRGCLKRHRRKKVP